MYSRVFARRRGGRFGRYIIPGAFPSFLLRSCVFFFFYHFYFINNINFHFCNTIRSSFKCNIRRRRRRLSNRGKFYTGLLRTNT